MHRRERAHTIFVIFSFKGLGDGQLALTTTRSIALFRPARTLGRLAPALRRTRLCLFAGFGALPLALLRTPRAGLPGGSRQPARLDDQQGGQDARSPAPKPNALKPSARAARSSAWASARVRTTEGRTIRPESAPSAGAVSASGASSSLETMFFSRASLAICAACSRARACSTARWRAVCSAASNPPVCALAWASRTRLLVEPERGALVSVLVSLAEAVLDAVFFAVLVVVLGAVLVAVFVAVLLVVFAVALPAVFGLARVRRLTSTCTVLVRLRLNDWVICPSRVFPKV